jgi:hypothetical protein
LAAALVALAAAACDSNQDPTAGGGSSLDCSVYTTCGSCTPVAGCGWCFTRTAGACVTDPDQCAATSEFTWTWEPKGCPAATPGVGSDAGAAAGSDAGAGAD